ncbi:MAG: PorV/PorQ family protein [Bacteroidota bacterium]
MLKRTLTLSLIFLLSLTGRVQAQTNVATTIGQFLQIEPSSRIGAMGNAGSAIRNEPMAAYFNPAAVGSATMAGVQMTHSSWLADISYDYAIANIPFGNGSGMMVNVTSLRSGDIAVRTVDLPLGTGEYYSVNDLAFGVGYGMMLTDRVSAGLQVTYMQENIWHSNLSTFSINFGTQYQLTDDGITLGASLSNFGTRNRFTGRDLRIRYDANKDIYGDNSSLPAEYFTEEYGLPVMFRVGIAAPLKLADGHEFLFVADATHPNNNTESVNIGGEYTFSQMFSLRMGYQNLFETDAIVGLTAGAGVLIELSGIDMRFDYAWTEYGVLDGVQRMTVAFSF